MTDNALSLTDQSGTLKNKLLQSDKQMCENECIGFFTRAIWDKLEEKSKEDLTLAFFYMNFTNLINDDESTPITKYTKTVENEIKIKLISPFINNGTNTIHSNSHTSYTTRLVNRCIDAISHGKFTLTLAEMLHLIKESSNSTCVEYAQQLRNYVINNGARWDQCLFYSKSSENYYITYPEDYRNPSAHGYEYDGAKTIACKNMTREIISWFVGALK